MLAGERQSVKKKALIIVCFILGFLLMYAASIGIQNLLDATDSKNPKQGLKSGLKSNLGNKKR
jgi:hypothetical protein